jgi:hypothetical protein
MSFLKRFGRGKDRDNGPRLLEHPRDLEPGDIIRCGFAAQPEFSGEGFTVDSVETLDTGGDATKLTFLLLSGVKHSVRLRVVDDDTAEIALEVLPETVFAAFHEDDITEVLAPDGGEHHQITARNLAKIPPEIQPWVATRYRQEAYVKAYLYKDDYRNRPLPTAVNAGEIGCDYSLLVSDDRQHSLEFRVYDGGRTEAYFCTLIPVRKIEELWPRSGNIDV